MVFEPALVAVGGVAGALLRWKVGAVSAKYKTTPYTTVAINGLGSFILGAAVKLSHNNVLAPKVLLLIGTGFCGSFTTMSTFSVDVVSLVEKELYGRAFTLFATTNLVVFSAALLGFKLIKKYPFKRNPLL